MKKGPLIKTVTGILLIKGRQQCVKHVQVFGPTVIKVSRFIQFPPKQWKLAPHSRKAQL